MGEIVKTAMQGTGWDVQLCFNCAGGREQARGVADARVPKPIPTLNPGTPQQPPNGPEDFGATGPQYLYWAYKGTHDFAKDPQGPRKQLRVIANIMEPRYYLAAVKRTRASRTSIPCTEENARASSRQAPASISRRRRSSPTTV
jgi:hypothetical protein